MSAEENAPQTGDDALDREALDEDEAADVARWFWEMLRWQTAARPSVYLANKMADGSLVHDVEVHHGEALTALLEGLWLPVRVPREGRNR